MRLHAPTDGVNSPLSEHYNEQKRNQLLAPLLIAAFLRLAADLIDLRTPASQSVPPVRSTTPCKNIEAMLECARSGKSWEDSMDSESEFAVEALSSPRGCPSLRGGPAPRDD
jgi:hypothetical protein